METKEILNIKELQKWLNTSESKIRQLIYKNEIPYFRIGNRYYFNRKIINHWIISKHNDSALKMLKDEII